MVSMKQGETREEYLKRARIEQTKYRLKYKDIINVKQNKIWHKNIEENNKKQRERYAKLPKEIKEERIKNIINNGIKRKEILRQQVREYVDMKCSVCGYNKCENALDFHHTDPLKKEKTVSRLISLISNWDKVKIEIDKCIILCANCHRELHALHKVSGKKSKILLMEGIKDGRIITNRK